MNINIKWKALLTAIAVTLAFWQCYPIFNIKDEQGKVVEKGKINLGLDLQGGMHLVLEVDTTGLTEEEAKDAPERALEVIRNRIDQFGVLEPSIQRQGRNQIIIQLPGVTDRDRAIELVGKTAHLEFKLVSDDPELLKKALAGETVPGYEFKYETKDKREVEPLLLEEKAVLTGDVIVDATTEFNQSTFNQPYVSLSLNAKGAALFSAITASNVNKRLAIVLDGKIYSAPVIRERIPSGKAQISGSFSVDEANDLSIVLRAGALPAPVKIVEERTVGPSLGKDSIDKGIRAVVVASILVFGFMAVYYLLAGLIADFALFLNIVLLMGAMGAFHATLTLPGIAGLVLTIGMAVDANVLIFERIREEQRLGKSVRASIQAGFDRAFLTIFDSNLTTLIAGLILFQFGTGPVKGFATTLNIGIITSMFTAIVVTKLVLDFLTTGERTLDKLRMMSIVPSNLNINFMAMRKPAYVFSIVLILVGMFACYKRGNSMYGIDFSGGTIQQFKFTNAINAQSVRDALKEIGIGNASIQVFGNDKEIIVRSAEMDPNKMISKFSDAFKDNSFEVMRIEQVGPSTGKDLRGKAYKALLVSIICMTIYVTMRFEFRFAAAGMLALAHDVLIGIGAVALTGREISVNVIAALLTIVGYSINDTIVIFDRIREDRKIMRKSSLIEIINTAINQTLSRTFLTSWTVIMVVATLFFMGGEVINDFAFVMLVGVIVGSYSTVFIASPIIVDWPGKKVIKK